MLSKHGRLLGKVETFDVVPLSFEPFKVGGELHEFGVDLRAADTRGTAEGTIEDLDGGHSE
jgi:hypothetical protein